MLMHKNSYSSSSYFYPCPSAKCLSPYFCVFRMVFGDLNMLNSYTRVSLVSRLKSLKIIMFGAYMCIFGHVWAATFKSCFWKVFVWYLMKFKCLIHIYCIPSFVMLKSLKNHVFGDVLWRWHFLYGNNHWVAHQVFDKMPKRTLVKFSQRRCLKFCKLLDIFQFLWQFKA